MYVSVEIITALGSVVAIIAAMVALGGWALNRIDRRFGQFEVRFEAELGELKKDVRALDHKVTELSVAVARLEGPTTRFVVASH